MALTADPSEYLARLDKNLEIIDVTPNVSTTSSTPPFAAVPPSNGTVAYVDNSQFYMTMFFAFALVLVILYLLERKKG